MFHTAIADEVISIKGGNVMKKGFCIVLAICLIFALVACGGGETPAPSGGDSTDSVRRVAMICDSSIDDGGWGAACYIAMCDAAEARGWETDYTDHIDVSQYVESMTAYCQLGYDLIFAPGEQYSDAVKQVAAEYPDINFAVLLGTEDLPTDNIVSLLADTNQTGYLAGVIGALMTKTNVFGYIGAMELESTMTKLRGFEKAAQAINPAITVKVAMAGDFNDTAKGMELANAMIAEGADVFYGDASAVDSGARQAIDAQNDKDGSITVFNIAQPADILGQNPCIITSVVTDNAVMLGMAMDDIEAGSFGNKVIYGNLQNGCVYMGKMNDDLVPPEIQAQVEEYIQKIMDGTFPN